MLSSSKTHLQIIQLLKDILICIVWAREEVKVLLVPFQVVYDRRLHFVEVFSVYGLIIQEAQDLQGCNTLNESCDLSAWRHFSRC